VGVAMQGGAFYAEAWAKSQADECCPLRLRDGRNNARSTVSYHL